MNKQFILTDTDNNYISIGSGIQFEKTKKICIEIKSDVFAFDNFDALFLFLETYFKTAIHCNWI